MVDEFTEKMLEEEVDTLQRMLENKTGRSSYVLAIVIDKGAPSGSMKAQGGKTSKLTALSIAAQLKRKAEEIEKACQ